MAAQADIIKIQQESQWGVTPTGSWTYLAVDDYGVAMRNEQSLSSDHSGYHDARFFDTLRQIVSGPLVVQVWPETVDLVFGLIGVGASVGLNSYCCIYRNEYRGLTLKHLGLKCNSARISSSLADPALLISADLIGDKETTDTIGTASFPSGPPFTLHEATLRVDGQAEAQIEAFTISLENRVVYPQFFSYRAGASLQQYAVRALEGSMREVRIEWTMAAASSMAAGYESLIRARDNDAVIDILYNYLGSLVGSGYDTLRITLSRVQIETVERIGGMRDYPVLQCSGTCSRSAAGDAAIVVASS